uniref:Rad4 beta-hairpin domain-containing protein n=1 Tax=Anopheles atroparvus TaxID=41427 RepID=A0AAG5CUT7_ANOAO
MDDQSMYDDVENEKDAESASSVADFSASEDEWTPEKVGPTKAANTETKGKAKRKVVKKAPIPLKPARVSRRIAAKNGVVLPEETDNETKEQASTTSEDDSDSEEEKKPAKKVKRKTVRTNTTAKRKQQNMDLANEEPIKLTTFTVEQLYRKYRPDLALPLPPADKPSTSKGASWKQPKEKSDGRDSESSGDDYLVDPSELDLDSEFFRPTAQESEQRKAVDLFFDCNAGVELTDSEDDTEPTDVVGVGSTEENQRTADVEMGKKLIQQINQSSEAYVQMLRLAEATKSSSAKQPLSEGATTSKDNKKPSAGNAQEDIDRLLVAGEKLPNLGGKSLTTGFGRQDFVAVVPTKTAADSERPKDIEITLKLGPEVDGKGRPQKRTFDVLTALKRFMNREKRNNQINLHKVSLLCWIGHGTYVNNELRKPSLMQFARKKLLPGVMGATGKISRPNGLTNLRYFQEITRYYRRTVMLKDDTMFYRQRRHPLLGKFLIFAIAKKAVYCKRDYILLFLLLLRTLGVHCRLVISPAVPAKHIPTDQLYKMNPRTAREVAMERQLLHDFRQAPRESMVYAAKEKLLALIVKQKETLSRGKRKTSGFTIPQLDGGADETIPSREKKLKLMPGSFLKAESNRTKRELTAAVSAGGTDDVDDEVRRRRERILAAYRARAEKFGRQKKLANARNGAEGKKKTGATKAPGVDYWVEVFCEHEDKWITIDVLNGSVYKLEDIVKQATQPIVYVMAWNNDGSVKDVSPRYISRFGSKKSKLRVEDEWLEQALRPYRGKRTKRDIIEDIKFDRLLNKRPFPEQISEYKNHPRYAIERYLLRNEAIYPPDAPILGHIREEPIYLRDCVHTLHSRESWLRQAKTVRMHEQPYKVVKAKAKYDRITGTSITGQTVELFGSWQVHDYEPPVAKDGLVPRSAYGNVDLFQPCMLPKGTVHLQLPGLNRICRRLRVDCAQAITGFEYRNGGCQAVYDGYVVCEEFRDQVLDEWYQEQVELDRKDDERRRKRIYGNWKRLIMGLCIRKKLKDRYNFDNM